MSAVERAGLDFVDRNVLLRFNNLQNTFISYVLTLTRLYMVEITSALIHKDFQGNVKSYFNK